MEPEEKIEEEAVVVDPSPEAVVEPMLPNEEDEL